MADISLDVIADGILLGTRIPWGSIGDSSKNAQSCRGARPIPNNNKLRAPKAKTPGAIVPLETAKRLRRRGALGQERNNKKKKYADQQQRWTRMLGKTRGTGPGGALQCRLGRLEVLRRHLTQSASRLLQLGVGEFDLGYEDADSQSRSTYTSILYFASCAELIFVRVLAADKMLWRDFEGMLGGIQQERAHMYHNLIYRRHAVTLSASPQPPKPRSFGKPWPRFKPRSTLNSPINTSTVRKAVGDQYSRTEEWRLGIAYLLR
ncbi:hypothetical protein DFP72DRAFT_845732 [Ephemerocybe angulata]|uniref:Uncharacterized protein n=1 Tax=Ephemerocybe angulata TaxID=980116 RepID=A0A8H6I5G9_9AGAR|nr:hypothetical protein DFP72DRAFT_845732 [Tulosesus angulatus]